MPTEFRKTILSKFPLRLTPSIRREVEEFSAKEGVSLNQFINVAVAEKLAHLRHEEWDRRRMRHGAGSAERALELLDQLGTGPVEAGDELPEGYVSLRQRAVERAAS